jgi:hypothetical protein
MSWLEMTGGMTLPTIARLKKKSHIKIEQLA